MLKIKKTFNSFYIQEVPRQRNSVSGRVTLRRPSLCFETQKWENEKLNRTEFVLFSYYLLQ